MKLVALYDVIYHTNAEGKLVKDERKQFAIKLLNAGRLYDQEMKIQINVKTKIKMKVAKMKVTVVKMKIVILIIQNWPDMRSGKAKNAQQTKTPKNQAKNEVNLILLRILCDLFVWHLVVVLA